MLPGWGLLRPGLPTDEGVELGEGLGNHGLAQGDARLLGLGAGKLDDALLVPPPLVVHRLLGRGPGEELERREAADVGELGLDLGKEGVVGCGRREGDGRGEPRARTKASKVRRKIHGKEH